MVINNYLLFLDHHCPFVGNCIGEGNISKFFLFLISVFLHCLNILIVSIIAFVKKRESSSYTFDYTQIISIIIAALALIFGICMVVMIFQQIYLISCGLTTNEYIRKKYEDNLFNDGYCNNWRRIFHCGVNKIENSNTERPLTNYNNIEIQAHHASEI